MKKLTSVIIILVLVYGTASSQSCLSEGITFTTQEQIDNFQTNNPGCTEIEGNVEITGNEITNLNGLSVLTAFWGHLWLRNNDALTSLTGLDNVTYIGGDLWVWQNYTLTSLADLDNVTSIGGELNIWENAALTSLTGLDNVTSVGGMLLIGSIPTLTNLTGLNNVTSVGGNLFIWENAALTSLSGLDNVTSVGGNITIWGNAALANLGELSNVISIGANLTIWHNAALKYLTGLDNMTSIGGDLWIEANPALISLTGLDNIDANSITGSLFINSNNSLATCEVQSVCHYLASPNATIEIYNNATGCNSQEEVEEACESVFVEILNPEDKISIFPNPANSQLTISRKNGTTTEKVIIFNLTGQKIFCGKAENNIIDISQLQPGMYLIEVLSGQRIIRKKLIIE